MSDGREHYEDLPRELTRDLRHLYAGPEMPPAADTRILAAARKRPTWYWKAALGVAASVAIAATLFWASQRNTQSAAAKPDYARTGDIRDAFYVARQLKSQGPLDPSWDENRDGTVDQKDIDLLAQHVVNVTGGKELLP